MRSDKKKLTPKQIRSRIGVIAVCLIFAAVAAYAFFGRSDNTRTHFDTVTGKVCYQNDKTESQNEFTRFFDVISQSGQLVYDEDFKLNYPLIDELINDKNFTAEAVKVRSHGFDGGLLIADAYSYVADYSVRAMDMLYIPHATDEKGNIVVSKPIRCTVRFNTKLAVVELQKLDIENYRLNFYDLSLKFKGDAAKEWSITAQTQISSDDAKELKKVAKNIDILSFGKSVLQKNEIGQRAVISTASGSNVAVRLKFNDLLYENFQSLTLTAVPSDGKSDEPAGFWITVNE